MFANDAQDIGDDHDDEEVCDDHDDVQDVCDDHDDAQANNNRLANYIDKVRQLQTENRRMTKQIQVKTIINRSSESSLNNLLEQAGENWETVEAYDSTQQYRQIVHHLYFHCFFL